MNGVSQQSCAVLWWIVVGESQCTVDERKSHWMSLQCSRYDSTWWLIKISNQFESLLSNVGTLWTAMNHRDNHPIPPPYPALWPHGTVRALPKPCDNKPRHIPLGLCLWHGRSDRRDFFWVNWQKGLKVIHAKTRKQYIYIFGLCIQNP